jgi:lipopolysaccharide exporter
MASRELPKAVVGEDRPPGTLGRKVGRGAVWSGASTVLLRIGNIAIMAVVARLVSPAEFGIFALAITIHAFVVTLAELGVASAVARSDVDAGRIAPTVAAISMSVSALLAGLMATFSGQIAAALGNPEVAHPIRILSIGVFLIGPFAVPGAMLQREFRQDLLFRTQLIGFVPGGIILILLASFSNGADAFAWSRVVGQAATGIAMIIFVGKMYVPRIDFNVLRPLLSFGIPLAGANLLSQILLNVDYVFLGRMMKPADVGVYMLAFGVASWPTAVIGGMLAGVTLPAFSAIRRDGGDIGKALRDAVSIVSLVAFPIAAFTAVFAGPIVAVLYGSQWTEAAPPLTVLSCYGAIFVICLLFANIIVALGRTRALLIVQLVALLCLLPSLYAGIRIGGLVGVGIAHVIVIVSITLPVYLITIRRTIGASISRTLSPIIRPALAAIAATCAAWLMTSPVDSDLGKLAIASLAMGCIYFAIMARTLIAHISPNRLRNGAPFWSGVSCRSSAMRRYKEKETR